MGRSLASERNQAETLAKMGEPHAYRQLVRDKVAGPELLQPIKCLLTGEQHQDKQRLGGR